MIVINKENIEEYLLLFMDGELSMEETETLMTFLDKHPQYQQMLEALMETKLEDDNIVFEDKEGLLKKETVAFHIAKKWKVAAMAAGVATLLGLGLMKVMTVSDNNTSSPAIASLPAIQKIVDTGMGNVVKVEHKEPARVVPTVNHKVIRDRQVRKAEPLDTHENSMVASLKPMPVADFSILEIDIKPQIAVRNVGLSPADEIATVQPASPERSFVNNEKLEIFGALASQVESLKEEFQERAKALKITSLAIRLGGKEITILK